MKNNSYFPGLLPIILTLGMMLFITGCGGGKTSTPTVPPSPEQVIEGNSGPKNGNPTLVNNLPKKNIGETAPPIGENNEVKGNPEDVPIVKPGEFDKEDPSKSEGIPGEGTKQPGPIPPSTGNYAQVTFTMTTTQIIPQSISILDGDLLPSSSIDGEFLYVFTLDGKPLSVGTFRDPLLAIGLPNDQNPGYSATLMSDGIFAIFLPGNLITKEILSSSSIEFFRLDPTIPFTTPVTLDTVQDLIRKSTPYARVDGAIIYELLARR